MKLMRKGIKAQGSIEFMALFPAFIALVLIMIAIALQWHAAHVTSQSSLEGASKGLAYARSVTGREAGYADITTNKRNDAKVSSWAIENEYSPITGYRSTGTAKNIMVNENFTNLGNPQVNGYVQAPGSWSFVPCDMGCD